MNRAQRRQLARTAHCGLCFGTMTHQDRVMHELPPPGGTGTGRQVVAHKGCATKDAQQRAKRAEEATANMLRVAENIRTRVETTQRAQSLGLWLPGTQ